METDSSIKDTILTVGAYALAVTPFIFVMVMFATTGTTHEGLLTTSLNYALTSPWFWVMQIAVCLMGIVITERGLKRLPFAAVMSGTIMAAMWQTFMGLGCV